jgi:hypothetical protein
MPSCHFVHLILLSSGPKVPKSGPFKNEGIHELRGAFSEVYPVDFHVVQVDAAVSTSL